MLILDWSNYDLNNADSSNCLKKLDPFLLRELQNRVTDFCNNCNNRAIQRFEPGRIAVLYRYFVMLQTFTEIANHTGTSYASIRQNVHTAYAWFKVYDKNQRVLLKPLTWSYLTRAGFYSLDGFCRLSGMHFDTPEAREFKLDRGLKSIITLTDKILMEVNEELNFHHMHPVTYVLSPKEVEARIQKGIPFRDVKGKIIPPPSIPAPTSVNIYYG